MLRLCQLQMRSSLAPPQPTPVLNSRTLGRPPRRFLALPATEISKRTSSTIVGYATQQAAPKAAPGKGANRTWPAQGGHLVRSTALAEHLNLLGLAVMLNTIYHFHLSSHAYFKSWQRA